MSRSMHVVLLIAKIYKYSKPSTTHMLLGEGLVGVNHRAIPTSIHEVLFDCLPYEWRSAMSDGLFLPIYPPMSMRVVPRFLMTCRFSQ